MYSPSAPVNNYEVALNCRSVALCLSWDFGGQPVDADLQVLCVNSSGVIVDAAYYNNLKACGRSVTHTGDSPEGREPGDDEKVTIHFDKLAHCGEEIVLFIAVVCIYSGGTFANLQSGKLSLVDEAQRSNILTYNLQSFTPYTANILSAIYLAGGQWYAKSIEKMCNGKHFMDCLPDINVLIRSFNPSVPANQKVAFAMKKGNVCDFHGGAKYVTCGLGWDINQGVVDLDTSAILMDRSGAVREAVFFGNLRSKVGVVEHSGDNLTGEGDGDDEQVRVDVSSIPDDIYNIFLIINIYTTNKTFVDVANPYCRVVDETIQQEVCHYKLREVGHHTALVIGRLARDERTKRWGFHALGQPTDGRTWRDCVGLCHSLINKKTHELMTQQSTFMSPNTYPPPQGGPTGGPGGYPPGPPMNAPYGQPPPYGQMPAQAYGQPPPYAQNSGVPPQGNKVTPVVGQDKCCVVM